MAHQNYAARLRYRSVCNLLLAGPDNHKTYAADQRNRAQNGRDWISLRLFVRNLERPQIHVFLLVAKAHSARHKSKDPKRNQENADDRSSFQTNLFPSIEYMRLTVGCPAGTLRCMPVEHWNEQFILLPPLGN